MNKTARFSAAAIVALGLGAAAYFGAGSVGKAPMAPNAAYTLLDGSRANIESLRGKVVLVNFWSTDCTTCVHEMPQIVATHQKFKARGFETLAVAMSFDPPAYVISFAEQRKLPFGVAIDNTGAIAKSFDQVQVTPTTVLINKRGEIVKRFVGEPDFVALHQLVEKLLAET
jgi:peroxiredoxin